LGQFERRQSEFQRGGQLMSLPGRLAHPTYQEITGMGPAIMRAEFAGWEGVYFLSASWGLVASRVKEMAN
jgi:hypothetical protein